MGDERTLKLWKHILVIICIFSFSCSDESVEDTKRQSQEIVQEKTENDPMKGLTESILVDDGFDESQIKDVSEFAFRFPSINQSACSETIQPDLCEWGKAADDIVLLEVTDVSFVLSPLVDSVTGTLVVTCDAALFPALKIEGIIGESVNGNSGPITLKIGYDQYNRWNVWPYLNGLRKLTWSFDDFKIGHGSQIGLTLHKNPTTGTYSVLGEPFFQLDSENKIEFSDIPEICTALEPKNVGGKTFGELSDALRNCQDSRADERVSMKAKLWDDRKFADLGFCLNR